jgi:hypothetical protein
MLNRDSGIYVSTPLTETVGNQERKEQETQKSKSSLITDWFIETKEESMR